MKAWPHGELRYGEVRRNREIRSSTSENAVKQKFDFLEFMADDGSQQRNPDYGRL